ncbi:MAG TPA: YciI family protein [Thermoanaerobaculia bacterium]|nr:YciI family protein [Thermoanaerobaculia bacterium]HUM29029.1 YciI family protein [Thermoanaerobaculia bacterium]HXK67415.1 YciI family protein [Thermoanaerobaculia bacterium]
MLRATFIFLFILMVTFPLLCIDSPPDSKPGIVKGEAERPPIQYLIVLSSTVDPLDESAWTESQIQTVEQHVTYLKSLQAAGLLILAGRTQDAESMGLVLLNVETEEEARSIMEGDPAVKSGLFLARLHPYRVALMGTPVKGSLQD